VAVEPKVLQVGDASLTRAIVEARRAIGDLAQEAIVTVSN